jgi:hypothetical protein
LCRSGRHSRRAAGNGDYSHSRYYRRYGRRRLRAFHGTSWRQYGRGQHPRHRTRR